MTLKAAAVVVLVAELAAAVHFRCNRDRRCFQIDITKKISRPAFQIEEWVFFVDHATTDCTGPGRRTTDAIKSLFRLHWRRMNQIEVWAFHVVVVILRHGTI
jgi:hypothetical protein